MALSKKPVTGMKDILPAEMQLRDYCIGVIKETYAKFGFTSIETPCVENIQNLTSKQGGENEKLIFKILKRGEKLNLETAKEEGDLDGPFTLGVSIQDGEGQMVWLTSSYFLDDMYNAYSSGANVDMGMNILSALIGEREAISIRSKSLNYNYLTISESAASTIKVLLIGVFPLAYLGTGIGVVLYRRRRQNEAR